MNPIFSAIYASRDGHYIHALEVENVYSLEETLAQLVADFSGEYLNADILDFLTSLSIYSLSEDEQEEECIYSFDIATFVAELF